MIADDIGGVDGGEESNLVESGISFLLGQSFQSDNFDGKRGGWILFTLGFDNSTEAAGSQFHSNIVFVHRRNINQKNLVFII